MKDSFEDRHEAASRRDLFARLATTMAGKVKTLIEQLITLRTKGDRALVAPLKIKLIMKGVDPDMFGDSTPDSPVVIQRVVAIAKEMGYELR